MTTNIRPIRNRVIIRPDPPKSKVGRIIIPDSAQKTERLHTGIMVAMGPGMPMRNGGIWPMPDVKIGQRVFYKPEGAQKILLEDVEHHGVYDEQVWAVLEGEDEEAAEE